MMISSFSLRNGLLWPLLAVLIGACAAPHPATQPVPRDPAQMALTLVYPIVHERIGNGKNIIASADECRPQLDKSTYASILERFNTTIYWPNEEEAKNGVSLDDLRAERVEPLRAAKRANEQYILFTYVRRFEYYGASLYYTADAFLVDANSGRLVWKNTTKDSEWLGIFGGIVDSITEKVKGMSVCGLYGSMIGRTYRTLPQLQRVAAP